jgi:hypothetical protein
MLLSTAFFCVLSIVRISPFPAASRCANLPNNAQHVMLRRTKEIIANELPGKQVWLIDDAGFVFDRCFFLVVACPQRIVGVLFLLSFPIGLFCVRRKTGEHCVLPAYGHRAARVRSWYCFSSCWCHIRLISSFIVVALNCTPPRRASAQHARNSRAAPSDAVGKQRRHKTFVFTSS